MRSWVRDHGLMLANLALFVIFFGGMVLDRTSGSTTPSSSSTAGAAVSLLGYLTTGEFVEATFENWESEFLQMGMYVVLTAYLFQRGSSESKPIDEPAPQDEDPREAGGRLGRPVAGQRGGWVLNLYENGHCRSCSSRSSSARSSCTLLGGARAYSDEELAHGGTAVDRAGVPVHVPVLVRVDAELAERVPGRRRHRRRSVYLRQRGSAESKPVAEPHVKTGA